MHGKSFTQNDVLPAYILEHPVQHIWHTQDSIHWNLVASSITRVEYGCLKPIQLCIQYNYVGTLHFNVINLHVHRSTNYILNIWA